MRLSAFSPRSRGILPTSVRQRQAQRQKSPLRGRGPEAEGELRPVSPYGLTRPTATMAPESHIPTIHRSRRPGTHLGRTGRPPRQRRITDPGRLLHIPTLSTHAFLPNRPVSPCESINAALSADRLVNPPTSATQSKWVLFENSRSEIRPWPLFSLGR